MIIVNSIWIAIRAVPAIIVIGIMLSILVDIQSLFEIDEVKRYYVDFYENVVGGPLTTKRAIFDVDQLDLFEYNQLKLINNEFFFIESPYIKSERFKYEFEIAQKCEPDECANFCEALYNITDQNGFNLCENFPLFVIENICTCHHDDWGFVNNENGDVIGNVKKGFWKTRERISFSCEIESAEHNIGIQGKYLDTVVPATMKLTVIDGENCGNS